MALGAQRGQVVGLVLRQAMVLALIGVGIGLAGSFAATPLVADFLYGIKSRDVLTLSGLIHFHRVYFSRKLRSRLPCDHDRSHADSSTRIVLVRSRGRETA